jgi:hypothetical protein
MPQFCLPYSVLLAATLLTNAVAAAPRIHVITFGKWTAVEWVTGTADNKSVPLKMLINSRRAHPGTLSWLPHEVTERLFVVRRIFRVNDSLLEDSGAPRWQWQRGGWMLGDRSKGRISPVVLPEFDHYYSIASWYQDYAAYCGISIPTWMPGTTPAAMKMGTGARGSGAR